MEVEQIYQQGSLRGLCCEYPIVGDLFGKIFKLGGDEA